jgi:hypothetical protein
MATPQHPKAKVAPPKVPLPVAATAMRPAKVKKATAKTIAAAHAAPPAGSNNPAASAAAHHRRMVSQQAGMPHDAVPRDPSVAMGMRRAPQPYRIAAARPRQQRRGK